MQAPDIRRTSRSLSISLSLSPLSYFSRRGQGNLYLRVIHSQVTISTFHYLSWFLRIFPLDFARRGITPSSVIMRMGIRADVQTTPLRVGLIMYFL